MSFNNLFVVLSSIGDIEMDVSLNEEHVFPAQVTRNPVEDGTQFSDHIVILPVVLNMTARVSDASMIPLLPAFGSKSIDAYNALVELQQNKEIIEASTGINIYQNMFVENITVPRQSEDGNSLRFELVISELLIIGEEASTNRELIAADVLPTALDDAAIGVIQKIGI